jgi:threonine dehydrogenase-like Zn-dependent dehydrogenase
MRALVYTLARTLDVLDVETPVQGSGEVLIRVERVGICGSDVQSVATRSPRRAPPLIMGHEPIGEVTFADTEPRRSSVAVWR